MRKIDLWGAEWWYWRKVKFNDPSLWNTAKESIKETNDHNQELRDSGKIKIINDIIKK